MAGQYMLKAKLSKREKKAKRKTKPKV